ncbi:hypothetical protein NWP17_05470 [Chrysosporum bergii ANA360D]|uniref:Uncharacterized protein n=1 Tax=Chrysosporum bergii ANA360D TaxID=617107 RepID=A0AA43GQR0_9CYAN|nr:hypothetical protein [Chrysosporum bergii]MDH6059889.1 hypothetical protein [Chrysosporum bergii ANA360D]
MNNLSIFFGNKTKSLRWLFVILVITFVTSCTPVAVRDKLKCEIPPVNSKPSKSDDLKVAIYVDGSGSMLGYVKDGKTNYVKALNTIRQVFELIGQLPVEYYRNDNPNQKITSSEYYSYAGSALFYDGSNTKFKPVSSPIDAAIIPPPINGKKMTVIITDLEQNKGDVTKLTKKIQDIYFNLDSKDYAVGVWAIKSEFNGTVYIQEANSLKTFTYSSGKQADKFRPFYILFIGPYQDIKYYFEYITKYDSQDLMANSNLIIFHPENIITGISGLETLPTIKVPGVNRLISLVKNGVSLTKGNDPGELLQIGDLNQESLTIDYSIPFYPAEYSLLIDTDKNYINAKLEVEKFDEFEQKFKVVNSSDVNSAFQLTNWDLRESKLNFSALIDPNKFPEPGVYKFKFDVFAPRLQAPMWWKDWDWEARVNDQDGTKTQNLQEFLIGLKNRTEILQSEKLNNSEVNNWLIGRFCYGVKKN